ncbi:MAG: uroporphyrinogen-III synthase [Acidobacteria bacterium]|nr:uroporphyrinogen-III synthase [Acidobacteriota bacterium]
MPTLKGARVALLEARMTGELSDLVRRLGGVPHAVPALREAPTPEQVPLFIDALSTGRLSVVIFLTGVGVTALFREAERLGRLDETLTGLRVTTNACRGPKPVAALRRHDVPVQIAAAEPYTTGALLDALSGVDLRGKGVALVHYGERNQALADALTSRSARLEEWCLYEWLMPEDRAPLAGLVRELIDERIDAIAFTSQIQWRHLFRVATDLGESSALVEVLNRHTIVAAIGPVCASALRACGVTPDILPAHSKMGSLIVALADYVELTGEG